jgi:hypothetical protein
MNSNPDGAPLSVPNCLPCSSTRRTRRPAVPSLHRFIPTSECARLHLLLELTQPHVQIPAQHDDHLVEPPRSPCHTRGDHWHAYPLCRDSGPTSSYARPGQRQPGQIRQLSVAVPVASLSLFPGHTDSLHRTLSPGPAYEALPLNASHPFRAAWGVWVSTQSCQGGLATLSELIATAPHAGRQRRARRSEPHHEPDHPLGRAIRSPDRQGHQSQPTAGRPVSALQPGQTGPGAWACPSIAST